LAPFTAEADSNLYRSHPDWFYADDTYPWKSESPPWKCMDLSVPEALDFVVDTVTQLHTAGARYFKLDFIDMALVPGRRRHTQRSGVELYRHALASIRAAAPDSYVLGCNPAMSATIDVVDALRIGEDTAPRWKPLESHGAGAHTALRTALGRTYLRASAEIDLDCMLLRQAKSSLTKGEIDTYVNAVIATGDQRFASDDLSLVSAADLDAAFRKVDYPNRIAVPSRPLDEDEPSTFDIVEGEDTVGKLLVNWGDTDVCMVPFLALGPRATEFHDSATGEPVGNRDICLEPHQSLLAFRAM
jgi:alpha-galactosidase